MNREIDWFDFFDFMLSFGLIIIVAIILSFSVFVKVQFSDEVVSGIVYDAKFNSFFGNKTCFKVRASENMAVSEKTSSTYCLNDDSQYKTLIEKASRDKSIKVIVQRKKTFEIVAPFNSANNVVVEEIKEK